MSGADRRAEVAASACKNPTCPMCVDYIETGNPTLRPATPDEYRAAMEKSYPKQAER